MLKKIKINSFTAFQDLELEFSKGMNVLIGGNGTGKTHLMKLLYSACDITTSRLDFADKLVRVFLPSFDNLGRLVKRRKSSSKANVVISKTSGEKLSINFSSHVTDYKKANVLGKKRWQEEKIESVFIPVKEMLSNAAGFRAMYTRKQLHFEEIYSDIIDRACTPPLRGSADSIRKKLLEILQKAIEGKVVIDKEEFYLKNKQGNLEFSLLAEGMRKLGLLWLLIQNGTLVNGAVLFWDEPETNLNPKLYGPLVEILLSLQREGVQIFLATHDYVLLKEIDLRMKKDDDISFISLYRDSLSNEIKSHVSQNYLDIHPNAIAEAFADLYEREIQAVMRA